MNCFVGIATAIPGTMIMKPGPSVWGNEIFSSFTQGNNFTSKKFTGILTQAFSMQFKGNVNLPRSGVEGGEGREGDLGRLVR